MGNVTLPGGPGSTDSPTASGDITRYETNGNTQSVTYDSGTDKIMINNLPFDGTGVFDRDNVLPTLVAGPNGFTIYENNNITERRAYKTIYGASASGNSSVAITRTGDYQGFGFGGFVYERNGGVTLPSTGQATYTGNYAGVRVFTGTGGLQYTTANATLIVDFEDFDATDAVEGTLTNRQYFDQAGNPLGILPTLIFSTGSITDAGEIGGTVSSQVLSGGVLTAFESGEYYAVLSGPGANEMVGVIIVTGDDPNDILDAGPNTTVQETGGFILTSP
ncbi:MAG: hypothetical protein LJE68_17325 [Rhodobacter sp.]|nr:hypothetical protein [Rhodobacter sp.]